VQKGELPEIHAYRSPQGGLDPFGRLLCAYVAGGRPDEQQEQDGQNAVNQDPHAFAGLKQHKCFFGRCSGVNALISLVAEVTFLYRTRPLKFA
jgi:hypothetical protein